MGCFFGCFPIFQNYFSGTHQGKQAPPETRRTKKNVKVVVVVIGGVPTPRARPDPPSRAPSTHRACTIQRLVLPSERLIHANDGGNGGTGTHSSSTAPAVAIVTTDENTRDEASRQDDNGTRSWRQKRQHHRQHLALLPFRLGRDHDLLRRRDHHPAPGLGPRGVGPTRLHQSRPRLRPPV